MEKEPVNKQIDKLIPLLEDPDQEAYKLIHEVILQYGLQAVAPLEEAWFQSTDLLTRTRVEEMLDEIQISNVHKDLTGWVERGGIDLMEGFLAVTKFQYPNIDSDALKDEISKLVRSIWIELNDNQSSIDKVQVLNYMLFKVHKFVSESPPNMLPEHFFLNNLMHNRIGNSTSMALLYLIMGEKLKLPLEGIILPHKLIAAYTYTPDELTNDFHPGSPVKFYIDPDDKGKLVDRQDITIALQQHGLTSDESSFNPVDNIEVLRYWCISLEYVYISKGMPAKAKSVAKLLAIL